MSDETKDLTILDKLKLYDKIDTDMYELGSEIFDYVKKNHIGLLMFGELSGYNGWDIAHNNCFSVSYSDKRGDPSDNGYLWIPIEHIDDGTWKAYLQELDVKRLEEIAKAKEFKEKMKREKELKLLKELKEKYE